MLINQRMLEVLTQAADAIKQQDQDFLRQEQALEEALRSWISKKCEIDLPDEVAFSVELEPIDRYNFTVRFQLIPNPQTPLFYVRLVTRAVITKGRLKLDLDNSIWHGFHGTHRRIFADLEQAVRFALTGQK